MARFVGLLAVSAIVLAGCATTSGGGSNSSVVKRADQRWDALLAGEFEKAYEYYSPGFRSSHSRGDFELTQRLRKVQYRDAEFVEQDCDSERCTLSYRVRYHISSPLPGLENWDSHSIEKETWIKTQDEWWFLPD